MNERIDWLPGISVPVLKLRAALLRKTRRFFDERGYCEAQTPVLCRDTTVDRWLEPPSVTNLYPGAPEMFLQTSPEFAMKRLLAAGSGSIYQICPAFRANECGTTHNPEFTIVEWYGVGDDYAQGMTVLSDLCSCLLQTPTAEIVEYRDAFIKYAKLDPFAATMSRIRNFCESEQICIPEGFDPDDRDSWLDVILTQKVQPCLGQNGIPTIVHHYPASQSALAQVVETGYGQAAERFELFYQGFELADGYHELADGQELRRRHEATNRQRAADGNRTLPSDAFLIHALDSGQFPPSSGCALGFDRVVMLATGLDDIDQAVSFSWKRA